MHRRCSATVSNGDAKGIGSDAEGEVSAVVTLKWGSAGAQGVSEGNVSNGQAADSGCVYGRVSGRPDLLLDTPTAVALYTV